MSPSASRFVPPWLRLLALGASIWTGMTSMVAPRTLPAVCDGCLLEPFEADYFGVEAARKTVEFTLKEFEVAAKDGRVMLIDNASDGTAMQGWSCERLSKEFPDAKMRREYDWEKNPEDRNLQKLGDASWVSLAEYGADAKQRLSQDPDSPPHAPFYWGVREHYKGDVGSPKVVKKIRDLIRKSVPRFMNLQNADSLFDNAEFWLGAKGTGARAHMDSHCISTLSVVLSGERRWRIGPVPRMPKGAGRSQDGEVFFDDGVAYNLGWKPMFEVVAKEGQAVFFPPGWIHETLNTAPGCTVALTTQFNLPSPMGYYRSYYNRLRRVGDLGDCWRQMKDAAKLGKSFKLPKNATAARTKAEELAADLGSLTEQQLHFYDLDGDGTVSKDEFVETFVSWVATERMVKKEKVMRRIQPDMSLAEPTARGAASEEL